MTAAELQRADDVKAQLITAVTRLLLADLERRPPGPLDTEDSARWADSGTIDG